MPRTTNNEKGNSTVESSKSAVSSIHLPPFWDEQLEVWFITVENQFKLHHTTDDEDIYSLTLAALPQNIVRTVLDIVKNPPIGNKYKSLKEALIQRNSVSAEKRLDDLLSGLQTMGDLRPSQFYRLLEEKAGDSSLVNKNLLKNLWLKRLPESLRISVAGWAEKDITEIVPIADQIWVFAQPKTSSIAATNWHQIPSEATSSGASDLARLETQLQMTQQQLANLTQMMSRMDMNMNRGRSPARRSNFHNRSKSRSNSRSGLCYYHRRFGPQARTCRAPCCYRSDATQGVVFNNSKPSEN